jgi:serine phosphatase RsbU (regulator of sigma subunit)
VNKLYEALEEFAGGTSWQDDVTIMSVTMDDGETPPSTDTQA